MTDRYRFGGYQMPMVQLDSTGASYIQIPKAIFPKENHNQPQHFKKPYYRQDPPMTGAQRRAAMHGRLYKPLDNNNSQ